MKIVLDLSALLESGQLTPAEAEKLKRLAKTGTRSTAINLLVGFGLIAVVASLGALMQSAVSAVALGAVLAALGCSIMVAQPKTWDLLAQICVVVGTLTFCGGIAVLDGGSLRSIVFGIAVMVATGTWVRSGVLVALAVLAVGTCLGSSTDYKHALYTLTVEEPTMTILVFALIALGCYVLSLRLKAAYERLALIAARVAVLSVNIAFWIGSLWGDDLVRLRMWLGQSPSTLETGRHPVIPSDVFGIGWAVVLVAVIAWALRENRMWIVNTAAVFGAIHFYTQWFERLGADPVTVLMAGVLTLMFALGLWRFNRPTQLPLPA